MMTQVTFDEYNQIIDKLLRTNKYRKFSDMAKEVIERILEMLEKMIMNYSDVSTEGAVLGAKIALYVISGIIAFLLLIFIIRFFRRGKKKKKVKTILGEEINEESSVTSFRERGELCRLNGQYREATRLQFIAILFHFHQNNILYHDHTMTGKEMVDQLKSIQYVGANTFKKLVDMFNFIWYGQDQIDQEQYEIWSKVEKAFWQEVRR